jgi:hypothetical protein
VLDITSALSPTVVGTTASVTAASLVAPGTGARILYAYRDEDVLTPVVIPDAPSAWHAAREVDLLVIAPRSLLPALQPLADQREREGLRVALVDIEDVYDEFSAGQKDALAIRSFVSGALQAWSRPPRFLLLAGAATYDPRGWLGRPELDQVPTIPLATRYMETGSDDALVTLDGSEFPSLAVGRLPLSSLEDMQAVVAKILGRPLATPDGTVLLVHDRDANVAFSKASDEVKAALAGWRTQDLARGDDDDATHVQLLDRLRAGPAAVDYQGHGAEDMWNGRVLSTEDVGALSSSGGTTLLVASTCLNAYFLDLGRESLGQALLRTPGGGAWGLWASSALTLPIEHALLSKTLLVATLREGKTLGEATLAAKQAVTDLDVRRSFQLLGDPSARAVTSTPAALTVTPSRGPGAQGCSASGSTRGSFAVLTVVGLWLLATRRRAAA